MTGPAALRCHGLSKSFDGVTALRDVSLAFPPAGIVAVVGPNGAGKTTLINVLTGFTRPTAGTCWLGDRHLTELAPHRIARAGIARTFQALRLIQQMSAMENVLLARPRQRGESLPHAVTRMGVPSAERANATWSMELLKSLGLDASAHVLAGELSYGQQKLLSLACCMATEAPILLLDEPVAGVHPQMAEHILDLLLQLKARHKLVVFIEHDLAAVRRIADSVIVMDSGVVIAQGTPEEVLARPEVLEAFIA